MSILAGDKSGVPGVAAAKANELSARRLPIWGVALRAPTPATPVMKPVTEPCPLAIRQSLTTP